MSLELTIGANVQPAVVAIQTMKDNLKSLKDQISKTTDPTEINRLTSAIVTQKNQLQQALAASNGFANSTFGVSRATRAAHNELSEASRVVENFSRGTTGAIESLSQLLFTFERSEGITGGFKGAITAIGETLLSPAGLISAFAIGASLLGTFIEKLFDSKDAAEDNKKAFEDFKQSLDASSQSLNNFISDIQFASKLGQLRVQLGDVAPVLNLQGDLVSQQQLFIKLLDQQKDYNDRRAELITKGIGLEGAALEENVKEKQALQDKQTELDKEFIKNSQSETELEFQIQIQHLKDTKDAHDKQLKEQKEYYEKAKEIARAASEEIASEIDDANKLQKELDKALFSPPQRPDVPSLLEQKNTGFGQLRASINANQGAPHLSFDDLIDQGPGTKAAKRIEFLKQMKTGSLELAKVVQGTLTPAFESVFTAIENHQNVFKAFFKSLEQAVAQMIAKFLAAAAAAEIVSLILGGGGGLSFSNLLTGLLGGGGIPTHAQGGIATRPTLGIFGEAGAEALMPLDKLSGMLQMAAKLGSGQQSGEFRLSGNDLVLAINRTNRQQGRGG